MGSTQSQPCSYKSSEKTKWVEVVYQKKRSEFRAQQVPTYGPVGINSCLERVDR